ncbi:carbohydrate ABC transporter permease [Microbacterium maritypicum]|uniref:carbohydrate ABC transporter permease n=1 Tax=Microbacterium maritypicum TaxID=33918 RepID=UPI0037FDA3E3
MSRHSPAIARGKARFVFLCLAPAFALYTIFMVVPTIDVFRMSLFQWTGFVGTPTFIGFDNFVALASDQQFIRSFQNTVLLLVIVTIVTMCSALVIAALLMNPKLKARNVYRFILYLPSVLSIVVVAAIFSAVYDQENGLLNNVLKTVGLENLTQVWLGNEKTIMYSIAIAMLWQSLGYYVLLYLAGMSSIPADIYEAVALDGSGPVRTFFTITLPLVWTTLRTTLTFFIISSINLAFVLVRALTDGGPNGSSDVLLNYMYKQAYTNSSYGYGMAIGVVIFVFSFVLALIINRVTKREVHQF